MSKRSAERAIPLRKPSVEHDLLLGALPHPILVVTDGNQIVYGNAAAESFLSTSSTMMTRLTLDELVAFGCPLLTLVEQVRESGSTVNEYGVEMASPKFATPNSSIAEKLPSTMLPTSAR